MVNKIIKNVFKTVALFFFALVTLQAHAQWDMNMMEGVTPISHKVFGLHMFAIWICVGIAVVVYSAMIYSIIRHRKSRGAKAAEFHENTLVEIIWTVIPFVILIALAIPATKIVGEMEDTKNADVTIKVTGYQWKWQYEYLDQGVRFFSNLSTPIEQIYDGKPKDKWYLLEVDKPLVLPIHKKIRFLVTSNDVIHAWWVPDLGVKRDAIPGFIHESWANIDKPGIYRGQCAELCGVNHGFMPIVVKAVTEEEFTQWVAQQPKAGVLPAPTTSTPVETTAISPQPTETKAPSVMSYNALMKEGKAQYGKYCAVCHKQDGLGMPPVFPALKGSSVAVGHSIVRHIQLVLTGVPGTAMQAFADQLTDEELAAIVTYERNAWGNNTGDIVQPSDVEAVRHGGGSSPSSVINDVNNTSNEVKP